jgi:hypothetical protein
MDIRIRKKIRTSTHEVAAGVEPAIETTIARWLP